MKKYKIGYFLVERCYYPNKYGTNSEFKLVNYFVYKTLEKAIKEALEIKNNNIMIKECKIDTEGNITPQRKLHYLWGGIMYDCTNEETPIIPEKFDWKIVE